MSRGLSIAGRKHDDGIDYYQTPRWATEALLEVERPFTGPIWEPCCGAGAMSRVLEEHGLNVHSSDIRYDDDVYGTSGVDFLEKNGLYDNIITNPPYKYAQEMVEHGLDCVTDRLCFLLKLTFLESKTRYEMFQETPLARVHVFCKRLTMWPEGEPEPENSGTITFAWFVWEKGWEGSPKISWIMETT